MKNIFAVALIILTLAGCSTFAIVNQHQFAAQLAVEAATARVLHEHPSWRADAVAITGAALDAIDKNALIDLESVESYVKNKISWVRLLPEEQAVLSALITAARENVEASIRAKGLERPELQLVEVRKFIFWINETAKRQPA